MDTDQTLCKVTVDFESDWGGRTKDIVGISEGIPIILDLLDKYKLKSIFFISTEIIGRTIKYVEEIKKRQHYIGSHGHYHVCWREAWRAEEDKKMSTEILREIKDQTQRLIFYRAAKFSYVPEFEPFANPTNHFGLLKSQWTKLHYRRGQILYLHPFDLVGGQKAPNLFCKYWYSKPKSAIKRLDMILEDMSCKLSKHL